LTDSGYDRSEKEALTAACQPSEEAGRCAAAPTIPILGPDGEVVRPFAPGDLDGVHRAIQRTIDACYPSVYPPRSVEFFKGYHSLEAVSRRAADGVVVVVEVGDGIIATGAVVRGEITGVFVLPEYQGRGLGTRLMDELEAAALAEGHRSARLSVSLPSRGFYEGRGYRMTEECSDDMGEGQRLDYWEAKKRLTAE
jgi:GNAT superfamily N-acetyltransferase